MGYIIKQKNTDNYIRSIEAGRAFFLQKGIESATVLHVTEGILNKIIKDASDLNLAPIEVDTKSKEFSKFTGGHYFYDKYTGSSLRKEYPSCQLIENCGAGVTIGGLWFD